MACKRLRSYATASSDWRHSTSLFQTCLACCWCGWDTLYSKLYKSRNPESCAPQQLDTLRQLALVLSTHSIPPLTHLVQGETHDHQNPPTQILYACATRAGFPRYC